YPGALDCALRHLTSIGDALPEIGARLDARSSNDEEFGAEERRLRTQAQICAWLLEIAEVVPLVILVDDFEGSDEASAAVLATLAHQISGASVLLTLALSSDDAERCADAVGGFRGAALALELAPLGHDEVAALLASSFGEFNAIEELTRWMVATTGGLPL